MKIRSKLIVFFLVIVLIPLIIIGIFNYINAERMLTKEISNNLVNIAILEEKNIENVMEENLEKIQLISTRLQLKIELDRYNNNIDKNESQIQMNKIINPIKSAISNFEEISIIDLNGIVVASTNNSAIGKNYTNDNFFLQGKSQNEGVFLFKDKNSSDEIKAYLIGQLVLPDDNKLIGIVAAIYNLENLISIFQTHEGLGKTGELILVKRDDNGDALFISPTRFDNDATLNITVSKNQENLPVIQSLLRNEKTFTDTVDYRRVPVLAVTRYLEDMDLGLVAKIDKSEAFAPLENLKYMTIITTILIAILVIIVSLIIDRSISNPIMKLKDASKDISQGKFDNPIKVARGSSDEIDELSRQLDNMRQNIHYTNNHLNELVNKRTQKLEETIAELKEKEEALKKTNELLITANDELSMQDTIQKDFINVAAHELRTPIMPILGLSELLYKKSADGSSMIKQETLREHLQIIVRNSYRLHKLVEAILDITKIESQVFKLNIQLIELNEIISNVVIDFRNNLKNKNQDENSNKKVKIIYEPNRNKIFVNADKTRLTQALSNLLNNALKFTQEGFIIITTRIKYQEKDDNNDNNKVIVIIKDSGTGIDPEILPRLFTKFATKSDQGGTGLGLFIVKKIIEAHGGSTWAENNSNGIGSTFYFILPIVKTT